MFIFPCYHIFNFYCRPKYVISISSEIHILIISKFPRMLRWLCNNYIHSHLSYLHTISKSTKQYLSYLIEKYVVLSAAIWCYLKQIIIRTYSLDHLLSTFSFIGIMSLGEMLCFSFLLIIIYLIILNVFICRFTYFWKHFMCSYIFFFIFYYWYFFFIFILLFYSVLTY